MKLILLLVCRFRQFFLIATLSACVLTPAQAAVTFGGHVFDLNGRPLAQAMVTVTRQAAKPGIAAISVFTGEAGVFRFNQPFIDASIEELELSASALGYVQVNKSSEVSKRWRDRAVDATIIMEKQANQAATVPASAWLHTIEDPVERAQLITNCVSCHQFPSSEVRTYARAIDDVAIGDPQAVREQSWAAIAKYMRLLMENNSVFRRGDEKYTDPTNVKRIYSTGAAPVNTRLLGKYMKGRYDVMKGYQYGAPLAVTANTLIREYAIDQPNTIREALLAGNPKKLWVADVYSDGMIEVDVETGEQNIHAIDSDVYVGPKSIFHGENDAIWISPLSERNNIVARLDLNTKEWETWVLLIDPSAKSNMFDLAADSNRELAIDIHGRIWFCDVRATALGHFNLETGELNRISIPDVAGHKEGWGRATSLVMTSDKKHVWYTQHGIGVFGAFNVETMEFETFEQLPLVNSYPRRPTISDQDILYIPLFTSGQLVEYDTNTRQLIGIYDLPDTTSAPFAATWDNVRQIVWVTTTNANVIYRFEPKNKSFSIIPLPREGAFLRMISVDQDTGFLVTSYANISEAVKGPRMALIIDPGDNYQLLKQKLNL